MDVFATQTYFSVEILAFLETLLQIRRPVLVGGELVDAMTTADNECVSRDGDPHTGGAAAGRGLGGGTKHANGEEESAPRRGQFDQLRVGPQFEGRPYGELARYLIKRGAMPLGLYRPAGIKHSKLPFTQINPHRSEVLKGWPQRESTAHPSQRRVGRVGGGQPPLQGDNVFVLRSRSCKLFGSV